MQRSTGYDTTSESHVTLVAKNIFGADSPRLAVRFQQRGKLFV